MPIVVCPYPCKIFRRSFLLLLFFIISLLFSCVPSEKFQLKKNIPTGIDKSYIKVLLKISDTRLQISSKSRIKITNEKNGEIIYNGPGKDFFFEPDKLNDTINIESWGSPLSIDGVSYRGMIELHNILGNINVINLVTIHEYLYSVVAGEIMSTWNYEALKAQAIAARTYTYHHLVNRQRKRSIYDLDCTTNFQVYKGIAVEKESTNNAVDETSSKIMVYNDKPIVAFFHSTCGGMTSDAKDVWEGDGKEYLKPVRCDYCKDSPYYSWEEKLTLYEIKECLNKKYRGVGDIKGISFKRKNNRIISAVIRHQNGMINLTGNEFRLIFPDKKIKSLFFAAEKTKDGLLLKGFGWGHGVGMCQWGAKGMAEKGYLYFEILSYYYKGIRIINAGKLEYAGR